MLSDADLYARWMLADRAAGNELVDRHHVALLRWISSRAGQQDPYEVAQSTWLIAQCSATFAGRGSFEGWLRMIARSQLMKPQRGDASLTPAARTSAPSRVLRGELFAAINDLSNDGQREAASLLWIAGLSAHEIAAQTGTKLETVHSRLKLARAKLRARLSSAT